MRRHLKLGALLLSLVGVLTFSVAGFATPKAPAPGGSAHGSAHGTAADHGRRPRRPRQCAETQRQLGGRLQQGEPAIVSPSSSISPCSSQSITSLERSVSEGLAARSEAIAKDIREAQESTKAEQRGQMYGAKLAALESDKASVQSTLTETGKGERNASSVKLPKRQSAFNATPSSW